jgi:AcrR family transcriptional regulator
MTPIPSRPANELRRAGLTRERVLGAAVALADEGGLEELSMRKLAKSLGVEAMSLYNHIPNKEQLLNGMVELVSSEIDPPSTGGDWKAEMRKRAISTRAALNRHPWAAGLMDARPRPGETSQRLHEAVLACLRDAGFTIEMGIHASSVQDAYIYGFALQEKTLSHKTQEARIEVTTRTPREDGAALDAYPYSAEVLRYVSEYGFSPEHEFLYGLELILDGLQEQLARSLRR